MVGGCGGGRRSSTQLLMEKNGIVKANRYGKDFSHQKLKEKLFSFFCI
jgi:hypothetical protein